MIVCSFFAKVFWHLNRQNNQKQEWVVFPCVNRWKGKRIERIKQISDWYFLINKFECLTFWKLTEQQKKNQETIFGRRFYSDFKYYMG